MTNHLPTAVLIAATVPACIYGGSGPDAGSDAGIVDVHDLGDTGPDTAWDTDTTEDDTGIDNVFCFPNLYLQCGEDGNVHWFDSCWNEGDTFLDCPDDRSKCMEVSGIDAICFCLDHWEGELCETCPGKWDADQGCAECIGNWDPDQDCEECESSWVDEGDDCGTCPGNWDPEQDCAECVGNWDPEQDCEHCINSWIGEACDVCPGNWDPDADCAACVGNWDPDHDCAVCLDHWIDAGDDCGTCPGNWDPDQDCAACAGHWDPDSNCEVCLNEWLDEGNDCGTCPGNWDPELDCAECRNGWDPLTDCTYCMVGWEGADCELQPDCVRYVDVDADYPLPNGYSWALAFPRLQDGIDSAEQAVLASSAVDTCKVYVGEGIYYVYESAREDVIDLREGVEVYGGFIGEELLVEERDWELNETILDGHNQADGVFQVYRVVQCLSDIEHAVIDGFTITGGLADGGIGDNFGAGMLAGMSSPTIRNCTFTGNHANASAGGLYLNHVTGAVVEGCTFIGNHAGTEGGGVMVWGGTLAIRDTLFEDNEGSALMLQASDSAEVDGCAFVGNAGGGIYTVLGEPVITNCVFSGNTGGEGGGLTNSSGGPAIASCTFHGNSGTEAAGLYTISTVPVAITNCALWDGAADPLVDESDNAVVTYSDVWGGYPGEGNIDADPLFVDAEGGDFRLQTGSPCIDAADGDQAPEFDIEGNPRVDDPDSPNTGNGPPWADIGAYEHQP